MRDPTKRKSVPLRPETLTVASGIGDPMKRNLQTKLAKTTEDSLRENYGKHIRIFKTVIPVAITAQKAVQQDRAFMSMTRMELLQRRMQNLRGR